MFTWKNFRDTRENFRDIAHICMTFAHIFKAFHSLSLAVLQQVVDTYIGTCPSTVRHGEQVTIYSYIVTIVKFK